MDTVYNIEVIRSDDYKVSVDNSIIKSGIIKLVNDKKEHLVIVNTK